MTFISKCKEHGLFSFYINLLMQSATYACAVNFIVPVSFFLKNKIYIENNKKTSFYAEIQVLLNGNCFTVKCKVENRFVSSCLITTFLNLTLDLRLILSKIFFLTLILTLQIFFVVPMTVNNARPNFLV